MTAHTHQIPKQGLYDPAYERDACGVGLLLNIQGKKSHQIVDDGLIILENMIHRGAEGADAATGDGAGIMIQIPHEFILSQGIAVPEKGSYGAGLVFMPKDEKRIAAILETIKQSAAEEGLPSCTRTHKRFWRSRAKRRKFGSEGYCFGTKCGKGD